MNTKLQELTEKLYNEGYSKGKDEGDVLISKAKKEAEMIIKEAQKKAQSIIDEAQKKTLLFKENVDSEIKLASRQIVSALKSSIETLIVNSTIETPVSKALDNELFFKEILVNVINSWKAKSNGESNLEVLLSDKDKKAFLDTVKKGVKETFSKGVEVGISSLVDKKSFRIKEQGASFFVTIGEQEFLEMFRSYLRPVVADILFEKP